MKTKILIFILIVIMQSCKSVKPHEMIYLNDEDMQMGNSPGRNFENYVESIREGATPGASGKSSGGCGCN